MSDTTNSTNPGTNDPPQMPSPADAAETWRQCEARLQLLRSDLEQLANSNAPSQPANLRDDAKLQQVIDILGALAKDPFALIERGVQDAQKEAGRETKNASPSVPPKPEGTRKTEPAPTNDEPGETDSNPVLTNTVATAEQGMDGMDAEVEADSDETQAPPLAPTPAPNFASSFATPEVDSFNSNTAQAQASSDRLRAALEQNTQLTAAMFDQMLALIAGQNLKLGDVDRKMAELAGQLDSIKNP